MPPPKSENATGLGGALIHRRPNVLGVSRSSIGAAWVTANGVAKNKTTETIKESGSQIAKLQENIDAAAKKAEEAKAAAEQALGPCPSLSAATFGATQTYSTTHQARTGSLVELVAVDGSGCLLSGAILGYYFQRLQGDENENYANQIEIDGRTYKYPRVEQTIASGDDNVVHKTGIFPLPTIRYKESLRITYYYAGTGARVNACAVVLPDK